MDNVARNLPPIVFSEKGRASRTQSRAPTSRESQSEDADYLETSLRMMAEFLSSSPGAAASVRGLGRGFGEELAGRITRPESSLSARIFSLSSYWSEAKVGKIKWRNREKGILKVTQTSPTMVGSGKVQRCAFVEGLLEGFLNHEAKEKFQVRETRCSVFREHSCSFMVRDLQSGELAL